MVFLHALYALRRVDVILMGITHTGRYIRRPILDDIQFDFDDSKDQTVCSDYNTITLR